MPGTDHEGDYEEEELEEQSSSELVEDTRQADSVVDDEEEEDGVEGPSIQDSVDSDNEPLMKKRKLDKSLKKNKKKVEPQPPENNSSYIIPLRTTKRIMNLCPETMAISMEATFVMTNAAELFVGKMAHLSFENSQKRQRTMLRFVSFFREFSMFDSILCIEYTAFDLSLDMKMLLKLELLRMPSIF
jgi:hypothetical protein